jgi:hypothetical protein
MNLKPCTTFFCILYNEESMLLFPITKKINRLLDRSRRWRTTPQS